jgi:putative Mn2+ efflux pump MntP
MSPFSIAVLALSMSADAFAAAIGRGASERPSLASAIRAGLVFGVIEAITPIIGWALGLAAATVITSIDHWIAFALLGVVGAKMAYEAVRRRSTNNAKDRDTTREGALALVATAVGTSVDAAAVGVTLAFLNANIVAIALSIGAATFVMASLGMVIGRAAGVKLGAAVEFVGGLALIGLGLKILLEHTGVIA